MTAKSKRELRDERQRAEAEAEAWNARYRIGQAVEFHSHPEVPAKVTKTASKSVAIFDGKQWRALIRLLDVPAMAPIGYCRPCPSIGELMGQNSDDPRVTKREHYRRRLQGLAGDVTRLHERFGHAYAALAESRNLLDFQHEVRGLARDLESIADAAATLRDDVGSGSISNAEGAENAEQQR